MPDPTPATIEKDNADLEKAVAAAKYGDFDTALEILGKKPYVINCIPEGRAWGVLHQAVYWNNPEIVKAILQIAACDAKIKTKQARNNDAKPSSTASEVAEQMGGRGHIKTILEEHIEKAKEWRFHPKNLKYQVSKEVGEKIYDPLPLFLKALVQYKNTLLGKKHPKEHLLELLKELFKEEKYNWEKVEKQLHQALYGIDSDAAEQIKDVSTMDDFFKEIIAFYTGDSYYKILNNAVSKDFSSIDPTAEDTALALFDLLLDMIIMSWGKLEAVESTTYRGVKVDLRNEFSIGNKIMFTHFLSSSLDEIRARWFAKNGTLFIIDNSVKSTESFFHPKHIEKFSEIPSEEECLYGIGAVFEVTDIKKSKSPIEIHLKLIN